MADGSFFLMITMSGKKSISIDLCHAPMHFTILIFIPRHISNYYFFYLQLHSDYGRPNQICDGGVALTIDGGWLIKKTNFGIGIVLNRQVGDIALYIRPWFFPLSPGKKNNHLSSILETIGNTLELLNTIIKKKVTVIMSLWPMPQNIHMHFITSLGVVTRTNVFYLTRTGILVTSRLIYWKNMLGNVIKR